MTILVKTLLIATLLITLINTTLNKKIIYSYKESHLYAKSVMNKVSISTVSRIECFKYCHYQLSHYK
jgi:hypothetical protein